MKLVLFRLLIFYLARNCSLQFRDVPSVVETLMVSRVSLQQTQGYSGTTSPSMPVAAGAFAAFA